MVANLLYLMLNVTVVNVGTKVVEKLKSGQVWVGFGYRDCTESTI